MSLNAVPADILLEIADHLAHPAQVLRLYLTSSRIADALTPALYERIALRGPAQCMYTLDMLHARPDRARHIRSLSIYPDSPDGQASNWGRSALAAEGYQVSSAVWRAARNFGALRTFAWDGEELPPDDDLWFALRISCPRLKFISTSLGSILPPPNSHLFNFSDLYGFSLTFKPGFYWEHDGFPTGVSRVPGDDRLWNMLIKRCPNLEHLAIDGRSTNPHAYVDAHELVRGRWPKLRSLLIGDVVVNTGHAAVHSTLDRPLRSFFDAHPNLEALHLQSHAWSVASPEVFEDLHADALAKVSTFSGSLDQAQALPACASLKTLRVPEVMTHHEGTLRVSASLSALSSLASLTIAFCPDQGYDNGSSLRAVIAACPHLRHLDFTAACRPSFTVDNFSRAIRPLGKLRTLTLRIVPSPGEDSLRACGARLVRASPRLSSFDIVFLAPTEPHSLAHARFGHRILPWSLSRARASFVLAADRHGLPLALHVVERRQRRLWRGEAVLRATLEMRPAGAPGTRRPPLLALLMVRSPAGEEARLLLLCATLLVVVVWGCITL